MIVLSHCECLTKQQRSLQRTDQRTQPDAYITPHFFRRDLRCSLSRVYVYLVQGNRLI